MRRLSDWILAAVATMSLLTLLDVHTLKDFVYQAVRDGARRRAETGIVDSQHRESVEESLRLFRSEIAQVRLLSEENKARIEAWQKRKEKKR